MSDPVDVRMGAIVETFVTLADTLVDDFDVVELLHMLTERVVDLTSADEVGILLADETGTLHCLAASTERARLLELFQLQSVEGPCRDAYLTGRAVREDDLARPSSRWGTFGPHAVEVGFRSVEAVPMALRGQVLGALNLFMLELGGVGEEDRTLARAMADVATIGILQQRSIRQAQEVQAQLQGALQSRVAIEQAKGVVAEQAGVGVDDAFDLLRAHARGTGTKLSVVVQRVLTGEQRASDLG